MSEDRPAIPKANRAAPPPPDERDAAIERLERTLAEERQKSATLRDTVEALSFKLEVLEKGYAKQLADARERAAAVEQDLADRQARLAALEASHEAALRELKETGQELETVCAEYERLRKQLGRHASQRPRIVPRHRAESHAQEGTINEMLADASWLREQQPSPPSELQARLRAEQAEPETPSGEMIAPELVFTKGKKESDGGER